MLPSRMKHDDLIRLVSRLPYFEIGALKGLGHNETYVRIALARWTKRGTLVRLKKGLYVTRTYLNEIERKGSLSVYLEFLASALYEPAYLSLEYVLHQHNALTEAAVAYTMISTRKTARFTNALGNFIYRSIKKEFFNGFTCVIRDGFPVYAASKAKALFDYLYLRKALIADEKATEELRINTNVFTKNDRKELTTYVTRAQSARLERIVQELFHKEA